MIRALALGLLVACGAAWSIDPQQFSSAEEESRYWALIEELRCLVCQNQNLADSNAPLAMDLRDQVLEQIQAGKSDAQIKDYLVERYGDFVLYRPPVKPSTWGLWFGPLVIVAMGATVMLVTVRRRRQSDQLLADPDQERLDQELAQVEAEREGQKP